MYIPIMVSEKIGRPVTPGGMILLKVLLLFTCNLKWQMYRPLFTTGQLEGSGQTLPITFCPAQAFFFIRGNSWTSAPHLPTVESG